MFPVPPKHLCPADNYMFKVNNRDTRTRGEICSKLTPCSSVSIVNFEWVNVGWVVISKVIKILIVQKLK